MPRAARTVIAGIPHHVTQRGNRSEQVFFTTEDRRTYLAWLGEYARQHDVEVVAYCLMTNHVHLVAVPSTADGLQLALRPLHMRYAQRINRERGWVGHLWQGRYFSSALDEAYFQAAVRYVERNPVRAGMTSRAEQYPWSSAAAHCGLRADPLIANESPWVRQLAHIPDWSGWLSGDDDSRQLDELRRHAEMGLPCGSDEFIRRLEATTGRRLECRLRGRPTRA